jgi:hypothetical protein
MLNKITSLYIEEKDKNNGGYDSIRGERQGGLVG